MSSFSFPLPSYSFCFHIYGLKWIAKHAGKYTFSHQNVSTRVQCMKIINNITEKLVDDLRVTMAESSSVSAASSCFSVYAFEELKEQLEGLEEFRFIFTSPTFLAEKPQKAQGELYIPRLNRKKRFTAANSRSGCAADSASAPSPRSALAGSEKKPFFAPIKRWTTWSVS